MAELSSNAVDVYLLEKKQIHNDSTSVTFFGQYEIEDSKAVKLKHGFNKDHRPDCKQIVFGLNITAVFTCINKIREIRIITHC